MNVGTRCAVKPRGVHAQHDLALFDLPELLAGVFEICFGRAALQWWTVADAVELKTELDAIAPRAITPPCMDFRPTASLKLASSSWLSEIAAYVTRCPWMPGFGADTRATL